MKIIPNYIKTEELKNHIKNFLMGDQCDYYYQDSVAFSYDTEDPNFYFSHNLFSSAENRRYNSVDPFSNAFMHIALPLLGHLDYEILYRAKVNCYPRFSEHIQTGMHVDMNDTPHKVGLYSVNTNNGYTLFEDGTKVESVENQMVIFDGHLKHCSVGQTDEKVRVNVNINFW